MKQKPPETFLNGKVKLLSGDCLDVLATLAESSIDACVTDPPYHLTSIVKRYGGENAKPAKPFGRSNMQFVRLTKGFMGKQWDGNDIAFCPEVWREVFRVLKPGAHLLAMGGTRTYHRLVCAIENAGFEIRDTCGFLYGSGFPKNHDISKRIQRCECSFGEQQNSSEISQYEMRPVRQSDVSTQEHSKNKRSKVLHNGLSEQGPPSTGRQQFSDHARSTKSSMEGRGDLSKKARQLREREIRPLSSDASLDGEGRRLRDGASPRGSYVDWPSADEDRMRSSSRSQATEQCAEESGTVAGQPQPQERGAWNHCGRCGKPMVPDGLGTALKPAMELICLARKPLSEKTVAANVLRWGCGALNIDGCRIEGIKPQVTQGINSNATSFNVAKERRTSGDSTEGRWPANVVHDGSAEVLAAFPETTPSPTGMITQGGDHFSIGSDAKTRGTKFQCHGDSGSAARFFYQVKPNNIEEVVVTWISASEPHQATLLVDTAQLLGRATVVSASVSDNGWSTFLSRNTLTDLFRTASTCTIRTGTNSTTESRTWNYLISLLTSASIIRLLTSASIVDVKYETVNGGSHAVNAADGVQSLIITLGKMVSLPGASLAASGTRLKISVSAARKEQIYNAKRFWYGSKADEDDRLGARHPTIKPLDLMQYLVRLITPPKGTCLDPFAGTGTTGEAAWREGMRAVLIEREAEYQDNIRRRMKLAKNDSTERKRIHKNPNSTPQETLF